MDYRIKWRITYKTQELLRPTLSGEFNPLVSFILLGYEENTYNSKAYIHDIYKPQSDVRNFLQVNFRLCRKCPPSKLAT